MMIVGEEMLYSLRRKGRPTTLLNGDLRGDAKKKRIARGANKNLGRPIKVEIYAVIYSVLTAYYHSSVYTAIIDFTLPGEGTAAQNRTKEITVYRYNLL